MTGTNSAPNVTSNVNGNDTGNQPEKTGKGKTRITKDQVSSAKKLLAGLKPVKKTPTAQPGLSGQEFVKEVYADIVAATEKGYTLQQIAEILKAQANVAIAPPTLKNYISRAKAEKQKQGKGELVKGTAETTQPPTSNL